MKEHGRDGNDQASMSKPQRMAKNSKAQMKCDPLLTRQLALRYWSFCGHCVIGHWALFGRAVPNCRQAAGSTLRPLRAVRFGGMFFAQTNAIDISSDAAGPGSRAGCLMGFLTPLALLARVGEVETRDGQSYTGHIRLATNCIFIANAGEGQMTQVDLTNLHAMIFLDDGVALLPAEPEPPPSQLPKPWLSQDIGAVPRPGNASFEKDVYHLRGVGSGAHGSSDAFQFVYKTVVGDSEMVACINHVQYTGSRAQAGIMIRSDLNADAPNVCLGVTPRQRGWMQWRNATGADTFTLAQPDLRAPSWIRLKRLGDTFTGYKSWDGKRWRLAGETRVEMDKTTYVGLAVASGNGDQLSHATFNEVQEAPSVRLTSFRPRVSLRSGSTVVAGIQSADDGAVSVYSLLRHPPIATPQVASLQFRWLPDRLAAKMNLGRPGVLLTTGEFIDGDFRSLEHDRVTISSVLFGLRSYDVNHEVIAVAMGTPDPARQRFRIKTLSGSTLWGNDLSLGWNEVAFQEPLLGTWRLPLTDLKEIEQIP